MVWWVKSMLLSYLDISTRNWKTSHCQRDSFLVQPWLFVLCCCIQLVHTGSDVIMMNYTQLPLICSEQETQNHRKKSKTSFFLQGMCHEEAFILLLLRTIMEEHQVKEQRRSAAGPQLYQQGGPWYDRLYLDVHRTQVVC